MFNTAVQFDISHRAIVRGHNAVQLEYVPTVPLQPGELLVAPLVVGLCGTDIQMLHGERDDLAEIIGHEGVVQIIRTGEGCPVHLVPGAQVIINPTSTHDPDFLLGHNVPGLFQEYLVLPASAVTAGLVVPVVEGFPLELAPLIEPLATAMYARQLLQWEQRNGPVIVYGDGIVGHLALLLIRAQSDQKQTVIFVHHSQKSLAWSRAHQLNGDYDILRTDLASMDFAASFDAPSCALIATPRSGTIESLEYGLAAVQDGSRIDLLGGLARGASIAQLPRVNLSQIRAENCGGLPHQGAVTTVSVGDNKMVELCGHRGVSNQHLQQAMTELRDHGARYAPLITHVVGLPEAADFMQILASGGARELRGQRVMKLSVLIHSDLAAINSKTQYSMN